MTSVCLSLSLSLSVLRQTMKGGISEGPYPCCPKQPKSGRANVAYIMFCLVRAYAGAFLLVQPCYKAVRTRTLQVLLLCAAERFEYIRTAARTAAVVAHCCSLSDRYISMLSPSSIWVQQKQHAKLIRSFHAAQNTQSTGYYPAWLRARSSIATPRSPYSSVLYIEQIS